MAIAIAELPSQYVTSDDDNVGCIKGEKNNNKRIIQKEEICIRKQRYKCSVIGQTKIKRLDMIDAQGWLYFQLKMLT